MTVLRIKGTPSGPRTHPRKTSPEEQRLRCIMPPESGKSPDSGKICVSHQKTIFHRERTAPVRFETTDTKITTRTLINMKRLLTQKQDAIQSIYTRIVTDGKLTQQMPLDGVKSSSHSEYQPTVFVHVLRSSPIVQDVKVVKKIGAVAENEFSESESSKIRKV